MLRSRLFPFVIALFVVLAFTSCGAERASIEEIEQIAAALRLHTGISVADVGAGDGEWTEVLSARVGSSGRVYATEVDEEDVEDLRERFEDAGLENVVTLLGDQTTMGLPENCCDGILLRLVYHHFTDPPKMREELRRALRPGGRLVVVEIVTQHGWEELEGVPDRGGHGIEPEDLLEEMLGDGWRLVERHDDWGVEEDHYGAVFREAP